MRKLLYRLIHRNARQKLTLLLAACSVFVVLFTGIFSYLHSQDAVTNRMTGRNGHVTLIEPKWDSSGQLMAQGVEPGMQIGKDPRGWNDGQTALYIRLVLTVEPEEYTAKNALYAAQFPDDPERRVKRILESIRLEADSDQPFLTWDHG